MLAQRNRTILGTVDRNGAGAGTAQLDGAYKGTTVSVAGMDRVLVRCRVTKDGLTSATIRLRDASDDGNATVAAGTFPLMSQAQSHNSGAGEVDTEHVYTATTDDIITVDLKGAVAKLAVEVKAAGVLTANDRALLEIVGVDG